MIERLYGKVEKITLLERVADALDMCEIVIDFDTMIIFHEYNYLLQYLHQDVGYTTRIDYIHGQTKTIVCELVLLAAVNVVPANTNVKLISTNEKRTMCNFDSRAVLKGDFLPGAVAVMSSYEFGASPRAKWADCKMLDEYSQEFSVRIFITNMDTQAMENTFKTLVGGLVEFDLESSKYGLQTKEIRAIDSPLAPAPEISIAKSIVENYMMTDTGLSEYNSRYNFIDNVDSLIDGEPGYIWVNVASEFYLIDAIDNIIPDIDAKAMKRAAVCSYGSRLPHKTSYSKAVLNLTMVNKIPELKADKELCLILDPMNEEEPSKTRLLYYQVRKLSQNIIRLRRGNYEEDISNIINNVKYNMFGLL